MKNIITIFLVTAFIVLTLPAISTISAAETTKYWKLIETAGNGSFISPASDSSGWSSTENVGASGATNEILLKGELIHASKFSWTKIPDRILPGEEFSITVKGAVVSHKEPWLVNGHLTVQFYGALFPQYITVGDTESKTLSVMAPTGSPDVKNENHFLYLRFNTNYSGATNNNNPFQYI